MSNSVEATQSILPSWLTQYRLPLLLVTILTLDVFVMGRAAGLGATLSSQLDEPWTAIGLFGYWQAVDVAALALAFSQTSLLAAWAALSNRMRALRFLIWLGGAAIWILALYCLHRSYPVATWWLLQLCQASCVFGIVWLVNRRRSWVSEQGPRAGEYRQYSVSDMMLCLTVAGFVCLVLSWMSYVNGFESFRWVFSSFWRDPKGLFWLAAQGVGSGMVTCIALWAVSGKRLSVLRLGALPLLSCLLGWVLIKAWVDFEYYWTLSSSFGRYSFGTGRMLAWPFWYGLQAVLVAVVLLAIRWLGYPLIFPDRMAAPRRGKVAKVLRNVFAGGAVAGLLYVAVFVVPPFLHNVRMVRETEPFGSVYQQRFPTPTIILNVKRPLDATAIETLRQYPEITVLRFLNNSASDAMVPQLAELKHLQEIDLPRIISQQAIDKLKVQLPRTKIRAIY